jgi:hypothetical protein
VGRCERQGEEAVYEPSKEPVVATLAASTVVQADETLSPHVLLEILCRVEEIYENM